MKKFIIVLLAFLLTGCNAVISDAKASSSSFDLTIDSKDLDDSYSTLNSTTIELGDEDVYIKNQGTYILTGTMNNASVIVETAKDKEVRIVLDNVTINSGDFASIYIIESDKVTLTLAKDSINTLSDSKEHTQIDDNDVDSVIFSKADLVINGQGTLNVSSDIGHGIVSKDDLIVAGGTINVTSKKQGISGKDTVKIHDGILNITSGTDSIKSDNDEDEDRGFVYITGGTINIDSEDDAIQGYHLIQVDGGTININKSYEGLEAQYVVVNGGDLIINASDDGINAVDKSGSTEDDNTQVDQGMRRPMMMVGSTNAGLTINGGSVYINASGDGIDSNGTATLNGGSLLIDGPVSGGDQAFDYETGGYAYGSETLCIGSSQMAESFSEESTQCNLLYNLGNSYEANSEIVIYTEDKEIIFNHTSKKSFASILLTSSKIKQGDTITIKINDDEYTYTFTNITNSEGQSGFGNPGQRGNMQPGEFSNMPGQDKNFDPSNMPERDENFNPEDMRRPNEEFDFENRERPDGEFTPPDMPEGFDPNTQPPNEMMDRDFQNKDKNKK